MHLSVAHFMQERCGKPAAQPDMLFIHLPWRLHHMLCSFVRSLAVCKCVSLPPLAVVVSCTTSAKAAA